MYAFLAWFAEPVDAGSPAAVRSWRARADAALDRCSHPEWERFAASGAGWQVLARHVRMPGWRWSFASREGATTVISAGLPVGVEAASPVALGQRLLAGEDVHATVVPPFGLIAVDDGAGRFAIQQDWYGQGQVFVYRAHGAVAFSNRPSLLPATFGDAVRPDEVGWAYYLGNSAFAGDSSPVQGVRVLSPGERFTGVRASDNGFQVDSETRWGYDDIVREGVASRPSFDDIAEEISGAVRRAVGTLAAYWDGPLSLGLSGGKDSRLIAAALVSSGVLPRFTTNEETPAEGETARRLTTLLAEHRGLDIDHNFYVATAKQRVAANPLVDRARGLLRRYDFMFASTYLNRPFMGRLPTELGNPSITGVLGECITDVWLPKHWLGEQPRPSYDEAVDILTAKLSGTVPRDMLTKRARELLDAFVADVVDRAKGHGLDPYQVVTYGYLIGRMRRACTAPGNPNQVMPLAVPEVVRASFRLTAEEKAQRLVHNAVIARLVPEWADVPFVSYRTGVKPGDILRIWHGSGATELRQLVDRVRGPVTDLVDRSVVRDVLDRVGPRAGGNVEDAVLRQFAMAAVADQLFAELGGGRHPTAVRSLQDLEFRYPQLRAALRPVRRLVRNSRRVRRRLRRELATRARRSGRPLP